MSAVPNLPETVVRELSSLDAALHHLKISNKAGVTHVEHTEVADEAQANGGGFDGDTTEAPFVLHDVPVENQRPIRVIVIGAGYSGVYCGIRIPERLRNCELVIYEKNAGIGGTWYENQYPGAACDVPAHSYQFSFNPKPDWSAFYAPSHEIRDYIESSAKKYGADRFIKLEHEVKECTWNEEEGKWHVWVKRPNGEVFEDSCNVLISARGLLNDKQWPEIEGLRSFEGEIMHSAAWNTEYDFTHKRIGVIGSGSSAIQIIPKLQKIEGAQLDCFIRGRTWISPPYGQASQDRLGMGDTFQFSAEQIAKLKSDPRAWQEFRLLIEADANNIHGVTLKDTPMQKGAQAAFEEGMKARLAKKPHYYDWLKPTFAPGCRRLTPGPGFLEALTEDNVTYTRSRIARVEAKGIVTADGQLHDLNALVCATGFYASAAPPFPVTGRDGHTMREHWRTRATNYLSLATDRFPNHFFMLGPNGAIGEGSLTMMIESAGDYCVKAIRKIQKDNIKAMAVKPARVRDFTNYCAAYFATTVFSDDCQSWYRKDGQGRPSSAVTGLWPGSCLHCIEALRSPRWEDYEYEYAASSSSEGQEANQLAWLGNGWAQNQLAEVPRPVDLGWYLTPMFEAVPVPGRPEEREEFRIRAFSY